jgi:hypothetical protein
MMNFGGTQINHNTHVIVDTWQVQNLQGRLEIQGRPVVLVQRLSAGKIPFSGKISLFKS